MNQNIQYGILLLGILAITLFISIYVPITEGMGSPITGLTLEKNPKFVKDLQPFVTQFISTQIDMDDETRANIAILQNLLTVSVNTYSDDLKNRGMDFGDAHFLTTDNIPLLWDAVPDSTNAYAKILTTFTTPTPPPALDNTSPSKYMPDNPDVLYHDSIDTITAQSDAYGLKTGTAYVYDQNGNKIALPPGVMADTVTYYQPGTYQYSATTFVPSYEDSIYLSRTTGLSPMVRIDDEYKNNICKYNESSPYKLEEACQQLDNKSCTKSSCCVLLGGVKCVSGDKYGPKMQTNYSDVYVKNRDFYYYKNRCYGNCNSTIYKQPIQQVIPIHKTLKASSIKEDTSPSLLTPADSTWKTSTATIWGSSNTLAWATSK